MAAQQSPGIGDAKPGELRLNLLGPVEVRLEGRQLDITAPQQLAVLAILAAEPGRTLSTTQLAERLWGDWPPSSAVGALRNHMHALRRQFEHHGHPGAGTKWLDTIRGGYRLGLPVGSDATAVEALLAAAESDRNSGAAAEANEKLTAAQQLWRGDPLVGLPGPWAEEERARLRRLRSTLHEAAIVVAVDLDRYSAALAELEARVEAEPHGERWHELLMIALYRSGRRAEALDVFHNARRLLADELGVEPGPRLVRLHQEFLSTEPPIPSATHLVTVRDLPPAEGELGTPTQLPLDIADFVGREDLVHELADVLGEASDRRAVVAITGMAGVGKTTLAVHLAHRVRDHYPDGVTYLDLGGMDERPRSMDTLLAGALRSIGVDPGEIPHGLAERTELWRTTVACKRILLVLDNARDADHLTALLPGPGAAAVLVTSRSSLAELFDARLVPLDVLTPDQAWTLLERMVSAPRLSAEPEAAQAILRACGHLPLPLRIIGARLASRPGRQLAALAERLADEHVRLAELAVGNTSVELAFRASYRRLDPELSRAFVLVAFCDAPHLPIAAIAALLDREMAEAEHLCEALVDLGMLQTPEFCRYRYHDLLRLYARSVAEPAHQLEWPQALHRLVDFYLASAKNIVELRDPGLGADFYAATRAAGQQYTDERHCTAWAFAERFGLVALYRQVAEHSDAQTRTLAVDLALLLAVGEDAGEHLPQVAQALEALSRAAGDDGDHPTMARAELAAATARLIGTGDLSAEHALRHAGAVLQEGGDLTSAILAEQALGTVMDYRGKTDAAIEHHRRAIELGRRGRDPVR
ncbi:AfsR/SARP family transcriptional regulator [Nocardia pseudovaccinii]|uniref:AfsR/SARP family transcriptional regulator n=1 Tax=Nocardia pseudovaccinii TaxID=189540 RepID=UPI0007A4B1CE|nr:BTAD domain-containing putative transcriptional regulator [Nocardia pseudovaccinii]